MKTTGAVILIAICTAPCVAQVFVVDANNGPGTHFTTIAAAVPAVPDGAVLQGRAGVYGGFTIRAKSLSVLGESGVIVRDLFRQPIVVSGLAAVRSVTLRRLSWSNRLGPGELLCQQCAGTILVDECRADAASAVTGGYVRAVDCDRLLLRGTVLQPLGGGVPVVQAERSDVVLTDCRLEGVGYNLVQTGGRVQVSASSIVGGWFGQPLAAVFGGELVVHGSTRFDGGPLSGGAWTPSPRTLVAAEPRSVHGSGQQRDRQRVRRRQPERPARVAAAAQ